LHRVKWTFLVCGSSFGPDALPDAMRTILGLERSFAVWKSTTLTTERRPLLDTQVIGKHSWMESFVVETQTMQPTPHSQKNFASYDENVDSRLFSRQLRTDLPSRSCLYKYDASNSRYRSSKFSRCNTAWRLNDDFCRMKQEAQLMLTTGSTRLAVSRGQQTWYHSTCYI